MSAGIMNEVAGIAKCSAAFRQMQCFAGFYVLRGLVFIMEMNLDLCKNVLSEKEALQLYTLSVNRATLFGVYLRAQ